MARSQRFGEQRMDHATASPQWRILVVEREDVHEERTGWDGAGRGACL